MDLEEPPRGKGHRERAYGFSVMRPVDDLSDGSGDELLSSNEGGMINSLPKKGPNTATYSAALIDVGNFYSHIWKVELWSTYVIHRKASAKCRMQSCGAGTFYMILHTHFFPSPSLA